MKLESSSESVTLQLDLGKSLNLYEPQFHHLLSGAKNSNNAILRSRNKLYLLDCAFL